MTSGFGLDLLLPPTEGTRPSNAGSTCALPSLVSTSAETYSRVCGVVPSTQANCESGMGISRNCTGSASDTSLVATPDQGHRINDAPEPRAMHQRQSGPGTGIRLSRERLRMVEKPSSRLWRPQVEVAGFPVSSPALMGRSRRSGV